MRRYLASGLFVRLGAGTPTIEDCARLLEHFGPALQRQIEADLRDAAICALGELLAPGMPVRLQADAIRASFRRYLLRWQGVDRLKQHAPIEVGDDVGGLLLEIFQRCAGEPPKSAKQLQRILLSDGVDSETSGQLPLSIDRDEGEIR